MKETAMIIMMLSIISKIFGFMREIVLSYFYGASNISDAYLVSCTIPGVIFGFISLGVAAGYIPISTDILTKKGQRETDEFTIKLINLLILLCIFMSSIGIIFSEGLVRMFASGFSEDTIKIATEFTKISMISIFFTGIVSIFTSYLQMRGKFIAQALIGLPLNITLVISIFFSAWFDVKILSIGFVLASFMQVLWLIPSIRKLNFKMVWKIDFFDNEILRMIRMSIPVIVGVSVNQINVLVDRTLASNIAVGGISALNYANILNGIVQSVFVASVVTVLYPNIAKCMSDNNITKLKSTVNHSIVSINIILIPATIGLMIFSRPIVEVFFNRGAFDSNAVQMTSKALFYYAIGTVSFGIRDIVTRTFYALQDSKTPMTNGVLGVCINIILNLILSKYMGISGLALATAISSIVTVVILLFQLRKKIGYGLRNMMKSSIKILIASIFMGIISYKFYNIMFLLYSNITLSFICAVFLGILSYTIFIYFMKINEIEIFLESVKKRLQV